MLPRPARPKSPRSGDRIKVADPFPSKMMKFCTASFYASVPRKVSAFGAAVVQRRSGIERESDVVGREIEAGSD